MSVPVDRDGHARLTAALREGSAVAGCLPYADMTPVSRSFDLRVREHFATLHGIAWRDACPAYALGYMTYGGYDLAADADELQAIWDELFDSDLDWAKAKMLIHDVWDWMSAQS